MAMSGTSFSQKTSSTHFAILCSVAALLRRGQPAWAIKQQLFLMPASKIAIVTKLVDELLPGYTIVIATLLFSAAHSAGKS